jgi:Cu(I)/Ag(I) efflux system membrane fusion protein
VAGRESGDRVAIREGLNEGDQVVVSAQFLLDSEANMGAGLDRLDSSAPAAAPAPTANPHAAHPGT